MFVVMTVKKYYFSKAVCVCSMPEIQCTDQFPYVTNCVDLVQLCH